jgi:predicted nucleic-acid-binding protein
VGAQEGRIIAVDTNIVVRFVVRDDEAQAQRARALIENRVFLAASVLMESEWVLRNSYSFGRGSIADTFDRLCGLASIVLDQPHVVRRAIDAYRKGLDFADALHVLTADAARADRFLTFDAALIKNARKLTRLMRLERP